MKVSVGVSNRHVHLTKEVLNFLFGTEELIVDKELTQKGEFASTFRVTLKTEKNIIENVRVLGPCRNYNQVEISKTDAYALGINPPVRESGDLMGAEKITLIGPNGEITLSNSVIIPSRHMHISKEESKKYNLKDKSVVRVKINTEKPGIIENVIVKESDNYTFELHIDTDDANAFLLKNGDIVEIIE